LNPKCSKKPIKNVKEPVLKYASIRYADTTMKQVNLSLTRALL